MESELRSWIEQHTRTVEPLQVESAEAYWQLSVTGKQEYEKRNAELDTKIRQLYSSSADFAQIKEFERRGQPSDPLLARQLRLLHLAYLGNQSPPEVIAEIVRREKALESLFNNFRAELGGEKVTDNRIRDVLRKENSSETRRAAWEASKQIGVQAAEGIRELARLRNAEARRLGFRDYFAMSLELQELDEKRLFDTFDRLYRLSEEPFGRYKKSLDESLARRFGVPAGELRPWHYSDPFFQEPPSTDFSLDHYFEGRKLEPLAVDHFSGLGLDPRDILARSDLYEKPGKCQHAFCMSVDRKYDVRVLCNLVANERWMETLLHELGHGVYDKYTDKSLPYLLRTYPHILSTEAIAMLMGRFTHSDAWLVRHAGATEAEAGELGARLRRRLGEQLMILTRWVMVMTHFERDLYHDPDSELNPRWWHYVQRFQHVTPPAGRNQPDWAAKIHLAVAPVYYQNYLLGEMMASQLSHHLEKSVVGRPGGGLGALVDRPEVGEFLRTKVFEPGARYPWEEHLERATGEGLNPEHFVAQYEPSPARQPAR